MPSRLRDDALTERVQRFWVRRAELTAQLAAAESCKLTPLDTGNEAAIYARLRFRSQDGTYISARYVRPTRGTVPLVVLFHDLNRPPRGWHHLTRYVGPGYAVVQLEISAELTDITSEWTDGPSELDFVHAIEDAIACACVARSLPGIDQSRIVTFGEGFGGSLALAVAALLPVWRAAALNPYPCDIERLVRFGSTAPQLTGINRWLRDNDPRGDRTKELVETLAYVDVARLASLVGAEVLLGTGRLGEASPSECQDTLAEALPRVLHVNYPKFGDERINDFEDQFLAFLHA